MAKAALIICDIQKDIVNFFAEKETAAGMIATTLRLVEWRAERGFPAKQR